MKRITLILVGLLAILLFIGFKSLWDIDIAMGSALTRGSIISIGGFENFNYFYHRALISNLVAFFGLSFLTLFYHSKHMEGGKL